VQNNEKSISLDDRESTFWSGGHTSNIKVAVPAICLTYDACVGIAVVREDWKIIQAGQSEAHLKVSV